MPHARRIRGLQQCTLFQKNTQPVVYDVLAQHAHSMRTNMRSLPCLACLSACPFLHFALTDVMFVNAYGCELFGGNYYSYVHGIDRYPTHRHAPPRTACTTRWCRTRLIRCARWDCHICTGTGLAPATSAPGPGSPLLPHLHQDWVFLPGRNRPDECIAPRGQCKPRLARGDPPALSPWAPSMLPPFGFTGWGPRPLLAVSCDGCMGHMARCVPIMWRVRVCALEYSQLGCGHAAAVVCSIVVACCMLHVVRCILLYAGSCCMLHVACCMLCDSCMLYGVCGHVFHH
jgi:hypothetical protein